MIFIFKEVCVLTKSDNKYEENCKHFGYKFFQRFLNKSYPFQQR